MNVSYRILFLIIIFSLGLIKINAQEFITINADDLVNLKNEIKYLNDSLEGLNKYILEKDSLIVFKDSLLKELTSQQELLQSSLEECKEDQNRIDSITDILKSQKDLFNSQIQDMQEILDRNTAKLANGRLYFRYSDDLVQTSIRSLLDLKTESVKKDFEQALKLLQGYKEYSADIKSTLNALQSINRDEWRSKHQADEYKNKCHSILMQSNYFKNVYSKKSTGSWTIPYLDNLINVAKIIIEGHNPVDYEFANFTPLIEML